MVTSEKLASSITKIGEAFINDLATLLDEVRISAKADEYEAIKKAIGTVIGTVDIDLLWPLYAQHAHLEPECLKGWKSDFQSPTSALDGRLTDAQQGIADALTPEFIEQVDKALLSHATTSYRKVAMLVGLTMMDPTVRVKDLPDLFYRDRVKILVAKGLLVAEGNLDRMGFSEVKLVTRLEP